MAALRFLSGLFLLVAVIAAVADATSALSGAPFQATPLSEHWTELAPTSIAATKATIVRATSPWVWDTLIRGVIDRPTFVVFGLLAILAGFAGRRRQRINIFVN